MQVRKCLSKQRTNFCLPCVGLQKKESCSFGFLLTLCCPMWHISQQPSVSLTFGLMVEPDNCFPGAPPRSTCSKYLSFIASHSTLVTVSTGRALCEVLQHEPSCPPHTSQSHDVSSANMWPLLYLSSQFLSLPRCCLPQLS